MSSANPREEGFNLELRVYVIQYLVLAVFIALGIRFYVLQVSRHDDYQARAENNRIRDIPIPASRGAILDRNGNLLVDNASAFNVIVTPEDIANKDDTINALVRNLDIDRGEILVELNDPLRPKSQPILVKQNASIADRQWVAAARTRASRDNHRPTAAAGLQIWQARRPPSWLYRTGQSQAARDPDFKEAGYKSGDIIGQGGIEAVYDRVLRGKDGMRRVIVDSRGIPKAELERIEPIKGQDVITTLDLDLQKVAEQQFYSKNETGAAVAINPQNGEILAMVSVPSFDPNVFARNVVSSGGRKEIAAIANDPAHPMYNKAIQGTFPTGSTWKILMATAALEEGVITLKNSKIVCGGGIQVGNRFVHCGKNHGMPDIHAAIVHSCDGYFYRLGLKMGVDMIHDWVTRFGMGRKTGVDLPGEVRGTIPSREWKARVNPRDPVWKDFDTVLASIGQGSVAVAPIQLIRAEAGIVTGGEFHTPHLFKEARETQLAPVKYYEDKPTEVKLSELTVQTVDYGMWGVVNEGGTAGGVGFPRE